MARIFTAGFETDVDNFERNAGASSLGWAGGRLGGLGLTLTDTTGNHPWKNTLATDVQVTYHRLYFKVRRAPAASKTSFWNVYGVAQASRNPIVPQITASFNSSRQIVFDSIVPDDAAGSITIVTGVTALTLNTWYRLNIQVSTNSNVVSGTHKRQDVISYTIYDTTGAIVDAGSGSTNSTTVETGASNLTRAFSAGTDTGTFKSGGDLVLDDWVVDNALMPGAGFVTLVRPRAAGTYQEWTTNDYKRVRCVPYANNTSLTSAGASKRLSFLMQSFASKGILREPSGVIKSLRVSAGDSFSTGRASWNYGLMVNGVVTYDTAHVAGSGTGGFLIDRGTVPVQAFDTIEAVLRDGSGAGTNATVKFLGVVVDYEGPDYVIENGYVDAIQMYEGSFTGNGTIQEISVPFTRTAQPDFIFVRPSTNAGAGGWWHRGMGEFGDFSQTVAGTTTSAPICGVGANAFTVQQNSGVNTAGVTNKFFAISDPRQRLMRHGKIGATFDGTPTDNRNIALDNLLFIIEALIVWDEGNTSGGQATTLLDTTNNTDAASMVSSSTSAAANFIQSIATGTFQLGTASQVSGSKGVDYAAFRRTGTFTQQTLFDYGSYVGNGAASRTVTIDVSTAQAPGLLIIIAENSNTRAVRFGSGGNFGFIDGNVYTTTGITALNRTSFTVSQTGTPNLNTNGARYHYLAFGVGSDKAPCLLRATATEYAWADPVSPSRPQVTPGSSAGLAAPEFSWA